MNDRFKLLANNLSSRHLSHGKLIKQNQDVKGHTEFQITEGLAVSDLPSETKENFPLRVRLLAM